ncbi:MULTISPECIES: hypothetical protein [unclassified Acidovorax]|uniref:hypothetical protein n=1 Tax=unclassified Acidovorax TaxID=2684926 RepID=UPI002882E0D4|nr:MULTISPECIES: hypothetical protein [unclassified Acidovorax]
MLDPVFDALFELVDPTSGPLPSDIAGELVTHAKEGLRQVLLIGDAEPVWEDTTSLLAETLWTRDSLTAAAELAVIHGWTHSAGHSLTMLKAVCNAVSAVCAALEEYDDVARTELLQAACGSFARREWPQAPFRRAPAAIQMESLASEAERAGLLVEWCIKANSTLDQIHLAAESYPSFRAELYEKNIAYNYPDWPTCRVDEGLADVLQRQSALIKQMAGGAA